MTGWAHVKGVCYPEPDPESEVRERKRGYDRERRRKFIAAGLNWEGKPRKRGRYLSLAGWSEERKKARLVAQRSAWRSGSTERKTR